MTIDVYSATGSKKGTMELPSVFSARINEGLMHQALMRQQSNRRAGIAHAKNRGEVAGSTKKMYQQKHTGRARRGPGRSPLLRGGGKAFGPRSIANFQKDMPKTMRRTALASCLSFVAKHQRVIGLEGFPDAVKTKTFADLLKKLPVEMGRRIVIVIPAHHKGIELSARNVSRVKTLLVSYLNPEDLLTAKHVVFLTDAIPMAQDLISGSGKNPADEAPVEVVAKPKAEKSKRSKTAKKPATEKKTVKKKTSKKSAK